MYLSVDVLDDSAIAGISEITPGSIASVALKSVSVSLAVPHQLVVLPGFQPLQKSALIDVPRVAVRQQGQLVGIGKALWNEPEVPGSFDHDVADIDSAWALGRGSDQRVCVGIRDRTLVERTTCYVMLVHLPHGHSAKNVRDGLVTPIAILPTHLRRWLTWDQGAEMARHRGVALGTDRALYF
jgi:hypothetical protein